MSIYITGSLAYDRIMQFSGHFNESILADHLETLSVSFFIDKLDEKLGGVAGNIAYSLALLEEAPIIVARVGRDFDAYEVELKRLGLPLEGIDRVEEELTASCYIITDAKNSQITAFHAAAHMSPCSYTFPHLDAGKDIAIIGATNPRDMLGHPIRFKQAGVRYIFDPSQQLPVLPADGLVSAIDGAFLLIGNEYEISLIMEMTGLSLENLMDLTTAGVIVTHGEKGSAVLEKGKDPVDVAPVHVDNVGDPTGAGDAYRAGLIKGLVNGAPLEVCAALGSTCAAYCIESPAPQGHRFTPREFADRYEKTFGPASFPLKFMA